MCITFIATFKLYIYTCRSAVFRLACSSVLPTQFIVVSLFSTESIQKCTKCGDLVEEENACNLGDKVYHIECLSCGHCSKYIT